MSRIRRSLTALLRPAAAAVLALGLSACAAPQGGSTIQRSGDISRPSNLGDMMLSLREAPDQRALGVDACIRNGEANPRKLHEFLPVIAVMLDVAPEDSVSAFCQAVAEAAIAGDFGEADIQAFHVPRDQRDYRVFGRFLRAVLVAHERLGTQQVSRPAPAI